MKLFRTSQIAQIDKYTIENEPILDIDLMERASKTIRNFIVSSTNYNGEISVFCGPGNNGGDGLALARMLAEYDQRFKVHVYILDFGKGLNASPKINLQRLKEQGKVDIDYILDSSCLPHLNKDTLVIDALFGSGLNRQLKGLTVEVINSINNSGAQVLAIDIPSGLMGEDNTENNYENIIRASTTVTFQFPKLSFLFPENENIVGDLVVKPIGLHHDAIKNFPTPFYLLNDKSIKKLVKLRSRFSHKGTLGHALLISGSYGKMGAAILASKACLRAGVGLLTTHIPHSGYPIIQTAVPEAMTSIDDSDIMFTAVDNTEIYNAIGIGPGLGLKLNTSRGLLKLLSSTTKPMVIDADALNILSEHNDWLSKVPANSILTPHPKEFERLAGKTNNSYERMQLAIVFSKKYKVVLVVKGANTMIVNPNGDVWFNTTGNPGMATAGSGDVLTGIILALLAQGYTSFDAARVGVYVHGLAGDVAYNIQGFEGLIASDLIDKLGEAFKLLHKV